MFCSEELSRKVESVELIYPRDEETGGEGHSSLTVWSIWVTVTNCSVFSLQTED